VHSHRSLLSLLPQGDIRAIHAHLLESYQLKSQDGIAEIAMEHLKFGRNPRTGRVTVEDVFTPCGVDEHGRAAQRCFFRHEYDFVIAAPGWRFSTILFSPWEAPLLHSNGKHPALRHGSFESVNVPGLFFAGTAMHAVDYRVSSGGFIHGFRYLCRALHRQLEEEEADDAGSITLAAPRSISVFEEVAPSTGLVSDVAFPSGIQRSESRFSPSRWPHTNLSSCGLRGVVTALLRRINLAAGLFQVFGGLVDVLLLDPLSPDAVADFVDVGVLAALHDPSSFPPPSHVSAECFLDDPEFAPVFRRESRHNALPKRPARKGSDDVVERALRGSLFEEVPVAAVPTQAMKWAVIRAGGNSSELSIRSVDWITLSLEFGPLSKTDSAARESDPFALSRANVHPHNPEASHFLHPVLRYFSATLARSASQLHPKLRSTLHIIEDFHADWSHHALHIMALSRWLQDVGARRAVATAQSRPAVSDPDLDKAWARPPPQPQTTKGAIVDRFMTDSAATLYFRGNAIRGGSSAWFHALTVKAGDDLLRLGSLPDFVAIHFLSPTLHVPLSAAEISFTAALREELKVHGVLSHPRNASLAPAYTPPVPNRDVGGTSAAIASGLNAHLAAMYSNLTAFHSGLPVIVFHPRSGRSALRAEEFGVENPLKPALVLCAGAGSPAAAILDAAFAGSVIAADVSGSGNEGHRANLPVGPSRIFGGVPAVHLDGTDLAGAIQAIAASWVAAAAVKLSA
jgi:hypothetical protein